MNWWTIFYSENNIIFLQPEFESEKSERDVNPKPYLEWEYLSRSTFLVDWTAPNKQSFRAKSEFKSCDSVFN